MNKMKQLFINIRRSKLVQKFYRVAFSVIAKLPRNNKLIIFESFHGKQYSDSPRAIYEYIKEAYPEYQLYWAADRRNLAIFRKKNVPHVKRLSLKWIFLMARAKYWVINTRLPLWIKKPKKTIYLQTWHGTPLKKLGVDIDDVQMPGTDTEKYKKNFVYEASKWDYLVSPNRYSTNIFKQAFQFNKEVLETGYPRNDYLINNNRPDEIRKVKQRLGIAEDKKIILYAPTWRDNQFYEKGKYRFNIELDLHRLKEECGDTHRILLRMHYLVAENLDLNGYGDFVMDFSKHEDIRELYLISDILITDYSSVFFDYANLKRPILFFVYDLEDYRDNLRGFYFDFENEAPGPLVRTTEEMIREIKVIEQNGFHLTQSFNDFYEKFCYLEDGKATEDVIDKFIS